MSEERGIEMSLTGQQMKDLCKVIGDCFDLNDLTLLVRFDLGHQLANIVEVSNRFEVVVFDLLTWVDHRGETDALVRAMLAARPNNQTVIDALKKVQQVLPQRPAGTSEIPTDVSGAIQAVAATFSTTNGQFRKAIDPFAPQLEQAQIVIGHLKRYKGLHDILQKIDFKSPQIQRTTQTFRINNEASLELHGHVGELRDMVDDARQIAHGLPNQRVEEAWISGIVRVADALEKVRMAPKESPDESPEKAAMGGLKSILAREPSRINDRITNLAGDLDGPLTGLVEALSAAKKLQPALDDEISPGLTGLVQLRPQLLGLCEEHSAWQSLDNQLRMALESPGESLDGVLLFWPDISNAVRELCSLRKGQSWAFELDQAARKFEMANSMQRREGITDFARIERRRFLNVDEQLIELCGGLVQIAQPLRALLTAIGGT